MLGFSLPERESPEAKRRQTLCCTFPHGVALPVTFYDVEQEMRRTVEVQADSLLNAAETVLCRLMERH